MTFNTRSRSSEPVRRGLAAALGIARQGVRVAVVAPKTGTADTRTAALFTGSLSLLRSLGTWEDCCTSAEPILAIRIVDDMGSLLRAPEVVFTAAEVGLEALGCNTATVILTQALRRQVAENDAITSFQFPPPTRSKSDRRRPSCVSRMARA